MPPQTPPGLGRPGPAPTAPEAAVASGDSPEAAEADEAEPWRPCGAARRCGSWSAAPEPLVQRTCGARADIWRPPLWVLRPGLGGWSHGAGLRRTPMMEKAGREGDGAPCGPVLHIVVVGFHHKKGCQVRTGPRLGARGLLRNVPPPPPTEKCMTGSGGFGLRRRMPAAPSVICQSSPPCCVSARKGSLVEKVSM